MPGFSSWHITGKSTGNSGDSLAPLASDLLVDRHAESRKVRRQGIDDPYVGTRYGDQKIASVPALINPFDRRGDLPVWLVDPGRDLAYVRTEACGLDDDPFDCIARVAIDSVPAPAASFRALK